jgi:hypothetical protein
MEFNLLRRLHELIASSALMFHKVGDYEATEYILYDPPPPSFPLLETGDFCDAAEIYSNVLLEPEFNRTVTEAKRAWQALSAPRIGSKVAPFMDGAPKLVSVRSRVP